MTIEETMATSDGLGADPVPAEVYVVEVGGEFYVFARNDDAERFAECAERCGHSPYQTAEPVIDSPEHVRALLDALEDDEL